MDYTGQSLGYELDLLPNLPQEALDTDFKKAYPPDSTLGQELHETARVWKVYRNEAKAHDDTMLDGWNKTLDVLLIFAGLFSAVATAFLIDSYKLLQPDNSAVYMSTALYLLLLRDNVSSTLPLPPPPPLEVSASMLSRAVNWLWFTSLLLSLAVALLAILVKQWIVQYNARNTVSAESPCHWAVRHQLFLQAMRNWPVAELVSILPVMLHFALFLFFSGITLFLWDLDLAIAAWIAVLSLMLGGLYIASNVIPLWIPECPTATPLVEVIGKAIVSLQILRLRTYAVAHKYVLRIHNVASDIVMRVHPSHVPNPVALVLGRASSNRQGENVPLSMLRPPGTREHLKTNIAHLRAQRSTPLTMTSYSQRWHDLQGDALLWLIFSVADSDSRAVGVQALGAVGTFGALESRLRGDDRLSPLVANMAYTRSADLNSPAETARIIRSRLWLSSRNGVPSDEPDVSFWIDSLSLRGVDFGDMLFLSSVFPSFEGQRIAIRPPPHSASVQSDSLNSTVLLFLRARRLDFANFLTALLWCNFRWLADTDWTFLLERIIFEAHAETPLYILPGTRHRFTVLDVLAQLIISDPVQRNAPTIHRLIVAILPSFVPDSRELCNHSFIYHYLASDAFASQKLEDGILAHHIPSFLYGASQIMHPIPSVYDHPPTVHLLLSAVTVSVHMQKQAGLTFDTRYNTFVCVDAVEWYTLRVGVQDAPALSLMLRRILEPTERLGGLSLWGMLRSRWGSAFFAMRLIQALCVAERLGEDVSDLVDDFLPDLSLQDLADMFNLQWNDTPDGTTSEQVPDFPTWVEPAIRHCIELRPTWWFDNVQAIMATEDPGDKELVHHIHEIETILSRDGPSTDCWGVPLGWEDDHDPGSSCAFNPSIVPP